jgi:hypothetical protein
MAPRRAILNRHASLRRRGMKGKCASAARLIAIAYNPPRSSSWTALDGCGDAFRSVVGYAAVQPE